MKPEPREPGEVFADPKRKSPAELYVRSLDGEFYMLSEVAEQVGISGQTLRRLIKNPNKTIKAPSYKAHLGDMPLYIFTPEDIEEIRAYYYSRYDDFPPVSGEKNPPGRPRFRKDLRKPRKSA